MVILCSLSTPASLGEPKDPGGTPGYTLPRAMPPNTGGHTQYTCLWSSVGKCRLRGGGWRRPGSLRSDVRGTPNGGAASWWAATANQRPPASPPRPAAPCRWWKILLSGEWPKHWWALVHLFFYSEKNSGISFEKFTIISKACAGSDVRKGSREGRLNID